MKLTKSPYKDRKEYHTKDACQHWPKSTHAAWADSLGIHDKTFGYTTNSNKHLEEQTN